MKRRDFLKFSAASLASLAAPQLVFCGETRHKSIDGMPQIVEAAESFVVLPDTQVYAMRYPDLFDEQTRWIVDNKSRYNIRFVLHVGDVTNNNDDKQWKVSRNAFRLLDGQVPYAICLGNHDLGPDGDTTNRDSLFGKYFPMDFWNDQPTFGGVYDGEPEKPDNSFHRFSAAGTDWLVLALEFGPRDDVLRWANKVTVAHPNHKAILLTHGYLLPNGQRYDKNIPKQLASMTRYPCGKSPEGCNDGQMMWDKLVARHKNFSMVFSGHVCTSARLESVGKKGNRVNQFLVDYQNDPFGGNGWMRLCQANPGGVHKLQTTDFTPKLNKTATADNTCFEVEL
jgi:Calcineurin-like phosphoesterase